MPDKAWKKLERKIGKLLGGERIKRMGDFSQSATDVLLHDLPNLRIDCKLRKKFKHHALFEEIKERYCKSDDDEPLLITKEYGKYTYLVTVDAHFFKELLDAYRKVKQQAPQQPPAAAGS